MLPAARPDDGIMKFGGVREISVGLKSSASGGFHFRRIEEANRITFKSPLGKLLISGKFV